MSRVHPDVEELVEHGHASVSAAIHDIKENGLDVFGMNRLSAQAKALDNAFKRAVLRQVLLRHQWNLHRTSEALGLGGAGNVTRYIRDLGLSAEYRKARKDPAVGKPGPKRGAR